MNKMKSISSSILFAFLLIPGGFMQAQATKEYYPLIPESGERQWDTRRDFIWGESDYLIWWLSGDIELDGVIYRKMNYTLEGSDYYSTGLQGAFREEDRKVYVRWWDSGLLHFNEEKLYYDFNLQVGDWFDVGYYESAFIQVMAIEEVILEDGTVRNKYIFNDGWEGEEIWIEGVGSLAGVAHRFDPGLSGSFFSHLQCYFEDENLVWTDGECWDGIEEDGPSTGSGTLVVYPNPTKEKVMIEGVEAAVVQVYNILGQLVIESKENVIDLSAQQAGIYILKVITSSGVVTRQIVKK